MSDMGKLSFQIEVRRILEILSNDIYDSPYALLRENIQNAYDAILMRKHSDKNASSFDPSIDVLIGNGQIRITDNGIGMNKNVVSNNFWKAGSSGKNNEEARSAGVVGTFGIGAMANFGVCKSLRVITHSALDNTTIETFAERESLSVTEQCIDFKLKEEVREPGTEIVAELDDNVDITEEGAVAYLNPYVQYLKVPVNINGTNISGKDYGSFYEVRKESLLRTCKLQVAQSNFRFELRMNFTKQGSVKIACHKIFNGTEEITGNIALSQGSGGVYGLRNYFGLAPIPVPGYFNLGGVVNLTNLHPTAGREALSRESIELVTQIVNIVEAKIAEVISGLETADINAAFHSYISATRRYTLAKKLKIEVRPEGNERWSLESVSPKHGGKSVFYYSGRDPQTILQFGNENTYLLLLSQENPRRKIQREFIVSKGVPEVPDSPKLLKIFNRDTLAISEVALLIRITNTLSEDYLITESKVAIASISHQVPTLVQNRLGVVEIYISRESVAVQQVLQAYSTAYEVFGGFVKDFVRNHLYQKFAAFVPSSTKQGADALHKILMRKRELYKYEFSDLGALESLLSDYVAGEIDFPEVLKKSNSIIRTHSQFVRQNQVGSVEQEIPSILQDEPAKEMSTDEYAALPPILRTDKTDKKILKTDRPYPHLNNFSLFVSLSDRVFKSQRDFFLEPHTTKVIWSMHKVVYIFTHASNRLSFYYDIELKERLGDDTTGGRSVPTTTIVTDNRIFIPISTELTQYFDIREGTKEFYVRYDIITDFNS